MGFCHTRAVLSSHWAVLGGAPPRDRENWAPRRARGPEPPPGAAPGRQSGGSRPEYSSNRPEYAPYTLSIAAIGATMSPNAREYSGLPLEYAPYLAPVNDHRDALSIIHSLRSLCTAGRLRLTRPSGGARSSLRR